MQRRPDAALVSGNNISQVKSDGIKLNGQDATIDEAELELEATVLNNVVTCGATVSAPESSSSRVRSGVSERSLCRHLGQQPSRHAIPPPFFDTDIVLRTFSISRRGTREGAPDGYGDFDGQQRAHNVTSYANPPAVIVFNGGPCTAPTLPPTREMGARHSSVGVINVTNGVQANSVSEKRARRRNLAEPFLSEIRLMSFEFAPKGWALCNGQLLADQPEPSAVFTAGHDVRRRRADELRPSRSARSSADPCRQWPHLGRAGRGAGAHAFDCRAADAHACRQCNG